MPNRIIKESATTSPTLDGLSDGCERMFWRMTTIADDAGRFDGDPRVLLAKCFPLKVDRLRTRAIQAWLNEMEQAGLIVRYMIAGRAYGYFPTWTKHQRIYGLKSKFPDPPGVCGNLPQHAAGSGSYPRTENRESRIDRQESVDVRLTVESGLTFERIVEQWNLISGVHLVSIPKVVKGVGVHKRVMMRLKEHPDIEWWMELFETVRASSFLTGQKNDFCATLDWVLKSENLAKVLQGNYTDLPQATHSGTGRRETVVGRLLREIHEMPDKGAGHGQIENV